MAVAWYLLVRAETGPDIERATSLQVFMIHREREKARCTWHGEESMRG